MVTRNYTIWGFATCLERDPRPEYTIIPSKHWTFFDEQRRTRI